MSSIEKSIEVDRDVTTVYNQWTQFEDFPKFMEGVENVEQRDDAHLHWETEIGLADKEFDAEVTEQVPDEVVAWRAIGDTRHDGRVTFEPVSESATRVSLRLEYDPQGFLEKIGDAANLVDRRVSGDLQRFKEFIESQPGETGGWRGEVH